MPKNDLVVGLQLDGRDFVREGKSVVSQTRRMKAEFRDFGRSASFSTSKASRGFLELSRGVEDFAVSFSTGGVAGGLRGAANNLSQFAAMMNPLAGAITGIGIAALTAWTSYTQNAKKAEDATKSLKNEIEATQKRLDDLRKSQDFNIKLGQQRGEITDKEALELRLRNERKILGERDAKLENLRKSRRISEKGANTAIFGREFSMDERILERTTDFVSRWTGQGPTFQGAHRDRLKELEDEIKKEEELRKTSVKRITDTKRELTLLNAEKKKEAEAKKRERLEMRSDENARLLEEGQNSGYTPILSLADRNRFGRITGLGLMPQKDNPESRPAGLPGIAVRGSAAAARAIAEAKNRDNIQKEQLATQKQMKQQLQQISRDMQNDQNEIVIESFGGMLA